ncbi:hypothetical protein PG984_006956 [Apiospora sp. TS-2023a]
MVNGFRTFPREHGRRTIGQDNRRPRDENQDGTDPGPQATPRESWWNRGWYRFAIPMIVACLAVVLGFLWLPTQQRPADIPRGTTPDNILSLLGVNGGDSQQLEPPRLNMMTHADFLSLQASAFETGSDFRGLLEQAENDLRATEPHIVRVAGSAGGPRKGLSHRLGDFAKQKDRVQIQPGSIPWLYIKRCSDQPGKKECLSRKDLSIAYNRAMQGGNSDWLSSIFHLEPTNAQIREALGNLTDRGVISQHAEVSRRAIRQWGNWAGQISDRVEMTSAIWESLESRARAYSGGDWSGHGEVKSSQHLTADPKTNSVLGLVADCFDTLGAIGVYGEIKS